MSKRTFGQLGIPRFGQGGSKTNISYFDTWCNKA